MPHDETQRKYTVSWVCRSEVSPVRGGAARHGRSTFLGAYDRNGVSHGHRRRTRSTLKRWRKRERSSGVAATGTDYFSRFAADMNVDWHPAPRRQFIITLSGPGYEIETSDGSVAQLPPGSVLLVEDIDPAHRLL